MRNIFAKESSIDDLEIPVEYSYLLDAYNRKGFKNLGNLVDKIWQKARRSLKGKQKETKKRYNNVLYQFLLNLYMSYSVCEYLYLAVPLSASDYGADSRFNSLFFTYEAVENVLTILKEQDLIHIAKGKWAGEHSEGTRTRIIHTEKLRNYFKKYHVEPELTIVEHEAIVLRKKTTKKWNGKKTIRIPGEKIEITDELITEEYLQMLKYVEEINEFQSSGVWQLDISKRDYILEIITAKNKAKKQNKKDSQRTKSKHRHIYPPNPYVNKYCRVFNCDFGHGGRFYSFWIQTIRSEFRKKLLCNGQPTVEYDYVALHPNLLYSRCGIKLSTDPYKIAGYKKERKIIKLLFNMLINARTERGALSALKDKIEDSDELKKKFEYCRDKEWIKEAIAAIKKKHVKIKQYLGTGVGKELQKEDSEIAEKILLELTRRKIHAVCIHDSFIVQEQYADILEGLMRKYSKEVCGIELDVDKK